ncbi:MAG: hypothetical protein JJT78_10275 [Leptospira sp.]|nr:hypothetical protein [Leptospira sp.]
MINEFFESLEPMQRAYWIISIPVTLVFALQMIMNLFGSEDGVDSEISGETESKGLMGYLSLQNLLHFLVGFSWSGIAFYSLLDETYYTIIISIATGILFVIIFYYISFGLSALSEDNSFRIQDILGSNAEVYLTIPGHMEGVGKVLVSHNGSVHELNAGTEGDLIPTGSLVVIKELKNENLLIVESL